MDQRVSRTVWWYSAVNRASDAMRGMSDLHDEWTIELRALRRKLEELRTQQSRKSKELRGALSQLIHVQDDYKEWRNNMPENFETGRTADKLDDVLGFEFTKLQNDIPQLEKFVCEDELEEYLDERDVGCLDDPFYPLSNELGYARHAQLPKGWGRD